MGNLVRELALSGLGIDSKQCGCDLVSLKAPDSCRGDQVALLRKLLRQRRRPKFS